MIQVYTGNGKGKTTASLGLALRACGHGMKVLMVQFMKGKIDYGEKLIAPEIPGFELRSFGLPTFVDKNNPSEEDLKLAKEGFAFASDAIAGGKFDMIILDEINVAVDFGLIPLDKLIKLLKDNPHDTEIVLTGRYANPKIIEMADLVSEIKEIKHPYQQNVDARLGIEF